MCIYNVLDYGFIVFGIIVRGIIVRVNIGNNSASGIILFGIIVRGIIACVNIGWGLFDVNNFACGIIVRLFVVDALGVGVVGVADVGCSGEPSCTGSTAPVFPFLVATFRHSKLFLSTWSFGITKATL